jgi:two-component system cell cycle sensor histidine kinase/response regulator CckA
VDHAQPVSEVDSSSLSMMGDASVARDQGTILLVEDEAFVREITGEILEAGGYRVLKTRNAAEALDAFCRYKAIVRLLLTDVVLPGRNGRDLASDLRAISPNLRTIFISGYPENAVTKNGIREDGTFYLPKPFSLQSLTRTVRRVLQPAE